MTQTGVGPKAKGRGLGGRKGKEKKIGVHSQKEKGIKDRERRDSNSRGQSPIDFESIPLTARARSQLNREPLDAGEAFVQLSDLCDD